jgi:hypothetical protein
MSEGTAVVGLLVSEGREYSHVLIIFLQIVRLQCSLSRDSYLGGTLEIIFKSQGNPAQKLL